MRKAIRSEFTGITTVRSHGGK